MIINKYVIHLGGLKTVTTSNMIRILSFLYFITTLNEITQPFTFSEKYNVLKNSKLNPQLKRVCIKKY